ncbi:MAG: hypothetical protein H6713_16405 [Myxococcales bacterium]|nr:hypothetical protein [Myxococcales bacterium]
MTIGPGAACGDSDGETSPASEASAVATAATDATNATAATTSVGTTSVGATTEDATETETAGADDGATLVHSFGTYSLAPAEETQPCVQWTLDNDAPVYINRVTLANDGAFHHSNWFVVPETEFAGPDGFFKCSDRGFGELEAAVAGTVLFAQSTQSRWEEQDLPEGVVIKAPPRHKVITSAHLLNLSTEPLETELRMSLDIIHPRDVDVVAKPFRLTYYDLDIPAQQRSRFTGACEFYQHYESTAKVPLDLKLYHVLPHYHYLGDHFTLEIIGGPNDGKNLFTLDGFNGDGNGATFDPPVDLTGAKGLRFTCGYNNWTPNNVGWGIGDQEMCVMLGLADSKALMDIRVSDGSEIVGVEDGVVMNEGPCTVLAFPPNAAQGPPTQEEIDGPLYVPPTQDGDVGLPPVDPCVDADPNVPADGPATLTSIRETIFTPSCTFSACHGGPASVHGLDLSAADLHGELLGHAVAADVDIPLVAPGDPEGSWLYQLVSRCEPQDKGGVTKSHMPLNAPTLLDDRAVAKLRAWIEDGAPAN